jgi:hypothetical protein
MLLVWEVETVDPLLTWSGEENHRQFGQFRIPEYHYRRATYWEQYEGSGYAVIRGKRRHSFSHGTYRMWYRSNDAPV